MLFVVIKTLVISRGNMRLVDNNTHSHQRAAAVKLKGTAALLLYSSIHKKRVDRFLNCFMTCHMEELESLNINSNVHLIVVLMTETK